MSTSSGREQDCRLVDAADNTIAVRLDGKTFRNLRAAIAHLRQRHALQPAEAVLHMKSLAPSAINWAASE